MKKIFCWARRIFYCTFIILVQLAILNNMITTRSGNDYVLRGEDTVIDDPKLIEYYDSEIFLEPEEPRKLQIEQFDVNENGEIAILHNKTMGRNYIRVISSSGEFLRAYSIKTSASMWVRWVGDNLQVIYSRSYICITFDENANVIEVFEKEFDDEFEKYLKEVDATQKTTNGKTYKICTDYGFFDNINFYHSQLAMLSDDGQDTLIYDVNDTYYILTLVMYGMMTLFVCDIFLQLTIMIKKQDYKNSKFLFKC